MTLYACVQILDLAIAVALRDDSILAIRPVALYTIDWGCPTVYAAAPESVPRPG